MNSESLDAGFASGHDIRMDWTLTLSLTALTLSIATFLNKNVTDKRDVFFRVHDRLLSADLVAARQVLYRLRSADDIDELSSEDRTQLFQLFGMLDLLGLYVRQGWVPLRWAGWEWAKTLRRAKPRGQHFIDWRLRQVSVAWPHYQWLTDRVEKFDGKNARYRWWRLGT